MEVVNRILNELPSNDLNLYFELGNLAGAEGRLDDSMKWYIKGLSKARELKNESKVREFSSLIIMHI
jgi:hypothetical protein